MLLNINKIIGSVIILSMLLTACSNNKEGDVKTTAETKAETKPEEAHEEAPATIFSTTTYIRLKRAH